LAVRPDGRSVVLSSAVPGGRFAIRLVDLDTGAVRTLRDGEFASVVLSPDGRQVAAVATGEDGNRVETFSLP
jgi:Tol biopolymer transport system component